MVRDLKSIAHAAIAHGFYVYLPIDTKNYFIASRLVCAECNEPWYTNLTECFLCGAINPFLYRCDSCKSFSSITKASSLCDNCGKKGHLHKECPNPECPTNNNPIIHEAVNSLGGVFEKYSGFSISLQYCLKCGSQFHQYQVRRIFVFTLSSTKVNKSDLSIDDPDVLLSNSWVIFRLMKNDQRAYAYLELRDYLQARDNFELTRIVNDFGEMINEIFDKRRD
jgi:hypothetical protein